MPDTRLLQSNCPMNRQLTHKYSTGKVYYALSVCAPAKFICGNPNPQVMVLVGRAFGR